MSDMNAKNPPEFLLNLTRISQEKHNSLKLKVRSLLSVLRNDAILL